MIKDVSDEIKVVRNRCPATVKDLLVCWNTIRTCAVDDAIMSVGRRVVATLEKTLGECSVTIAIIEFHTFTTGNILGS